MCGICGAYALQQPLTEAEHARVRAMNDALRHRGPDADGYFHTPEVALGHRRLSIIDLSPQGKQPIFNEDGSCAIVFNGEIYNYRELRRDLESRGHIFRSDTDTEVIIHQYEEDGWACVNKFIGMFAFAIWDARRQTLVLARDRIGIKPLYTAMHEGRLYFASELQALLRVGIPREVDPYGLYCLLNLQYVPAPQTLLQSIQKLRPGHVLLVKNGGSEEKCYWSVAIRENYAWDYAAAQQQLLELLTDAVRLRLIADVPLGAFLSGGLDSSTIVGLMSRMTDRPVQTFSVGFADAPDYNETSFARAASQAFKTNHHELIVTPADLRQTLPILWRHLDGPITDPAAIPTYLVSKLAREHVKVALTGEGADELFGGYLRYDLDRWHGYFQFPAVFGDQWIKPFLGRRPNAVRWLKGYEAITTIDPLERHLRWVSVFNRDLLNDLWLDARFQHHAAQITACFADRLRHQQGSDLNRTLALDLQTWLPDNLLAKVDGMSMAVSLEARVPFLDHRVIELAMQMPPAWKIYGRRRKRILKDMAAGLIPDKILARPKMGFDVPLRDWFRGPLKDLFQETLRDGLAAYGAGCLNSTAIDKMMQAYFSGRQDYAFQLWSLLVYFQWRAAIDQVS